MVRVNQSVEMRYSWINTWIGPFSSILGDDDQGNKLGESNRYKSKKICMQLHAGVSQLNIIKTGKKYNISMYIH